MTGALAMRGHAYDGASGLSAAEVAARRARYGPNVVASVRQRGPWRVLAAQFANPVTVLLAVAAGLSALAGERADASIIAAILGVGGLLGFWQEHRAAGAIARLLALVQTTTTAVRDGREQEVPLAEVVPGDVVHLRAGSSVPGDARLLAAKDLFVDEAALTGESFPVEKEPDTADRRGRLFLGTHVVSGVATAVVERTGAGTEFGAVAARLALRPPDTEFERGVRRFGALLLHVALVLALIIFAANVALRRPVFDALLFTLALTVGLTPQLLPAIVSVTLAQGARHMARERVIVRRLAAIEDLGGMTVLCTDKTGTITEGVVALRAAEDWRAAPNATVRRLAWLNAHFATGYANPIDEALRAAGPPDADATGWEKADEVPYDFVRKRESVVVCRGDRRLLVTKGALAQVLDACTTAESGDDTRCPLDAAREAIDARHVTLSRDGVRCLGVAYRSLDGDTLVGRNDERDMTFAGILGFDDPIKPGAPSTLGALAALGIAVKIVTGDDRHVAAHVAGAAGLDARAMLTGAQLRAMSSAALVAAAPRAAVFAEVDPVQKERVILALKQAGHAVGYLGDGINDAPALHAADVGISVDGATDVTKAAADVVLLDRDLGALVRGVREGRRAFANTLKYVFITTSANFGNMVSMAIASCFAAFLPMLPKQILLLNVLTDLPAMAIAADRLDPELVAEPRRWRTDAIRRFMVIFGLVSSAFDCLTFVALLALRVDAATFRTAWFAESALSELLVLLVVRTRRPFYRSPVGGALFGATLVVGTATLALPLLPWAPALGFSRPLAPVVAMVLSVVAAYGAATELVKRAVRGRGITL